MAKYKEQFVKGAVEARREGGDRRPGLRPDGVLRRLRLQQEPLGRVRHHLLPDRLPEGEVARRVHGGRHVRRDGRHRQARLLHRGVPPAGHRGAAARHQPERPRLHGRREEDPLRPGRREGRRREGHPVDRRRRARRSAGFESIHQFCEQLDSKIVDKKVVEQLIRCGAFDSTGGHRAQFMEALEEALRVAGVEAGRPPERPAVDVRRDGRQRRQRPRCPTSRPGPRSRSWPSRRTCWAAT